MTRPASSPHPGRSYTAASGALVRVDYVRPTRVQLEVWPAWWSSRDDSETLVCTPEGFAELVETHDLRPVSAPQPSP